MLRVEPKQVLPAAAALKSLEQKILSNIPKTPRVIVVFGTMGTGKSTVAKELTKHLGLPDDAFLEGDNTLLHPDLADLLAKVKRNEDLTEADVARIVPALIKQMQQKAEEKDENGNEKYPTFVVSQALYFNADRRKILDTFGGPENVAFVWIHTPNPIHISNLYNREYAKSLAETKNPTFTDKLKAFGHGLKALATNVGYSTYFEEPAGEYKLATSVRNLVKFQRGSEPVEAISFPNLGIGETKLMLAALPLAARKKQKKPEEKKDTGSTAAALVGMDVKDMKAFTLPEAQQPSALPVTPNPNPASAQNPMPLPTITITPKAH